MLTPRETEALKRFHLQNARLRADRYALTIVDALSNVAAVDDAAYEVLMGQLRAVQRLRFNRLGVYPS